MKRLVFVTIFSFIATGCSLWKGPTAPSGNDSNERTFEAVSEGFSINSSGNSDFGRSFFWHDGKELEGLGFRNRGINVASINLSTLKPLHPVQNFDTYSDDPPNHPNWTRLNEFLNSLPDKTLVMLAVEDEAGLTSGGTGGCGGYNYSPESPEAPTCCKPLTGPRIEEGRKVIESLGSTLIRNYCYRNSWSMISVKGEGMKDEALTRSGKAISSYTVP
jgi:hypothetical protein